MNKVILIGRSTKDVDVRYTQDGGPIARYSLAVDRHGKDKGADFINCTCFGKAADFAEKYITKGTKILVEGRIQTGSYDGKNGKVYTTDVIVDRHEFVENRKQEPAKDASEGFMSIPDDVEEEALPWNQG